jgi:hypothetical protein
MSTSTVHCHLQLKSTSTSNYDVSETSSTNIHLVVHISVPCYPLTLVYTKPVSNYSSFDFFDPKFDQSFYLKIYVKNNIFCFWVLYLKKFFKNDLNLTIFA